MCKRRQIMSEEKLRSIGAKMPESLHKKLRLFSAEYDLAIAEITINMFDILLDEGDELGAKLRERLTGG